MTAPASPPAVPIDVGRTLDERGGSGYQRLLVFLTATAIMFDGLDTQLLGVFPPVWALRFLAGLGLGGALPNAAAVPAIVTAAGPLPYRFDHAVR